MPEYGSYSGKGLTDRGFFYTGYPGTVPKQDKQQTGGVLNFGFVPGTPEWNATRKAYLDKQGDWEAALAALRGGQFMPSGLPNAAMANYTAPKGFDPRALQGRIASATDLEAGSRQNNLNAFERAAFARGAGGSTPALYAASQIRAGSAANLQRALNDIFYENEKAKLEEKGIAAGLLNNLTSQESAILRMRADALMDRPRDVIPGISDTGGGSPWKYLDANGRIIPRSNWGPAEWDAARTERVLYEQQQRARMAA